MTYRTKNLVASALICGPLSVLLSFGTVAQAAPSIDPVAVATLKRMTQHFDSVRQFSFHSENSIEDVDALGHRVDYNMSATVTIVRPDRLLAVRTGDDVDQRLYFNGKSLTLYSPMAKVYATKPSPPTLEGMITLARENIGIVLPAADLLYSNAFDLLTQDLSYAAVVGKAVIDGVATDHLLFSRPGADFQVWVAQGNKPWPVKYVVTDTTTPARLGIVTTFSDWNTSPRIDAAMFEFVPVQGVSATKFLPVQSATEVPH